MALTKIGKEGITGVSNAANATFLTATSAEGVTLAGTLAVTGVHTVGNNAVATSEGGANTTSIAQGLLKSWIRFNGAGTIAINDNFNCSSITDNATGVYTMTMQTAMANANYSQTCGAGDVDHGAKINIAFATNTTTAMKIRLAAAVSGNGDSAVVTNHVAGDLA